MIRWLALLALIPLPALAETWSGRVHVIDGDTVNMDGTRLKLIDIDAFESAQTCKRDGQSYGCGFQATLALEDLIHGQPVRCEGTRRDQYQRPLVHCWLGNTDLGGAMVRSGWALAEYTRQYQQDQDSAQAARLGAWAGTFQRPIEWRQQHARHTY